jgi:YggT family protein
VLTVVCALLTAYNIILFVRIIWSWFRPPSHGIGRSIFDLIYDLTEPVLRMVRGLIPAARIGGMGIDFSPILVFIILGVLQAALGCGFSL